MAALDLFNHLESRCLSLIERYIDPTIQAERDAIAQGNPLPDPDFDSLAAFRLLSHAELEGYFEAKAAQSILALDANFKSGNFMTTEFASLIFLFLWKQKKDPLWTNSVKSSKDEEVDFKRLAQDSLGFARQFIKDNNGVKENSITTLSALMGYFPSDIDHILISELNQYGKNRGEVAHDSWTRNTRTFDAANIEKSRLLSILSLIKQYYETTQKTKPIVSTSKKGILINFLQTALNFFRIPTKV